MQTVRLSALAAGLSLVSIGGCAMPQVADPELAEYRRVDARLRAIDEFEAFSRACLQKGGVVYTSGYWGGLRPRLPDLSTARCMAPLSAVPR